MCRKLHQELKTLTESVSKQSNILTTVPSSTATDRELYRMALDAAEKDKRALVFYAGCVHMLYA
jgi:hypothetical protein